MAHGAGRTAVVALLLGAGGLAAIASAFEGNQEKIDKCCSCLARSHNDFGELCISESTSDCSAKLQQGSGVPSSSRCLRDICGDECGDLAPTITPREEIAGCCDCLAQSRDPAGPACLTGDAETCTTGLDNGHSLASTRACLTDVCGTACLFLAVHDEPDAGSGDGG
ncbi:MAG: hypothetical protein JXR83_18285 [Deltaproteobacteria bacterium]|nr:hypothetical protein [Deltaproteobacteria bacterium]